MQPLKEKISITLDIPIIERIRDLAAADDRNVSQYINRVLRLWIENIDKKNANK